MLNSVVQFLTVKLFKKNLQLTKLNFSQSCCSFSNNCYKLYRIPNMGKQNIKKVLINYENKLEEKFRKGKIRKS